VTGRRAPVVPHGPFVTASPRSAAAVHKAGNPYALGCVKRNRCRLDATAPNAFVSEIGSKHCKLLFSALLVAMLLLAWPSNGAFAQDLLPQTREQSPCQSAWTTAGSLLKGDARPGTERAQPAPFRGLCFSAVLAAEIEYVDPEGPGGFANRDPRFISTSNRAGRIGIDKVTLDMYSHIRPWLLWRLELRAEENRAFVDRVGLEALPIRKQHALTRLIVGRDRPLAQSGSRRVETYSPAGSLFWQGREWHAGIDQRFYLGAFELRALGSIASQRDLTEQPMGEDPALPSIAFGSSGSLEDAQLEYGGLISASAFGVTLGAFGFAGSLHDNTGPERLLQTFDNYPLLGDVHSRESHWYGGRLGFDNYGAHFFAEAIQQRMGNVKRRTAEMGVSYTFKFGIAGQSMEVEPFARYGQLTITNLPEVWEIPQSWDREQWVLAALLRPLRQVELKIEYLILRERAGQSAEGQTRVDDNQLLVQLLLRGEYGGLRL
jgi:hypothetical protein